MIITRATYTQRLRGASRYQLIKMAHEHGIKTLETLSKTELIQILSEEFFVRHEIKRLERMLKIAKTKKQLKKILNTSTSHALACFAAEKFNLKVQKDMGKAILIKKIVESRF